MSHKSAEFLKLENLRVQFREPSKSQSRVIFDNFNLTLQPGELVCLLGPSGCGKSTLLRVMAELLAPSGGSIQWGDKKAAANKGFVFQEPHLLPWRNVLENTLLPLELGPHKFKSTASASSPKGLASETLEKVGLADALTLMPHELSGGMKMRVSLARALVTNPTLLFMDEPFAALDEVTRFRLQVDLRALCEEQGLTVVFVTHSTYEAAFLADRIVMLSAKGGRIVKDETVHYAIKRTDRLRSEAEYHRYVDGLSSAMQESLL